MRKLFWGLLFMILATGTGSATTIDFNDGTLRVEVDNFYYSAYGVTFSNTKWIDSDWISVAEAGAFGIIQSGDYTEGNEHSFGADKAIVATFSVATDTVSISAWSVGSLGMQIDAYDNSGNLVASQAWTGTGDGGNGDAGAHTLTVSYPSISSIHLYQANYSDPGEGLIFDNLTFGTTSPTPEPTTFALFSLGLLGVAGVSRRRS